MAEVSKENSQRGVKITKWGLVVERMCVIAELKCFDCEVELKTFLPPTYLVIPL